VHFVDRRRVTVVDIDEMVVGEPAVHALAARQHGVVSQAQLAAAGLGRGWVRHRVARGWLRRVHHGVYLVGPLQVEHTAAMAAVLATDGIVSSYPAAVLWDWRPPREGPMHVIANGRSRPDIIVHHTDLDPRDITRRHGIPRHVGGENPARPRGGERRTGARTQRGNAAAARQPSFPQ
jgi:hypothetical protein